MQIYYGTVLAVADVTIETPETGSGSGIGAVVGGIVGSTVGSGRGRTLATTGGALAGAAVGSAAERTGPENLESRSKWNSMTAA